jgi:hypothetical protein
MQAFLEKGTVPPDDPDIERELRDKAENFVLEDSMLMRCYPDGTLVRVVSTLDRGMIIESIHREIGHASARTIIDLLKVRGWWPSLEKDVRHFVRHCVECQLSIRSRQQITEELHPNTEWRGRVQPFERWGLDLIGKLPRTERGNIWIVTAIDYATRWPIAKALPDAKAETIADFI